MPKVRLGTSRCFAVKRTTICITHGIYGTASSSALGWALLWPCWLVGKPRYRGADNLSKIIQGEEKEMELEFWSLDFTLQTSKTHQSKPKQTQLSLGWRTSNANTRQKYHTLQNILAQENLPEVLTANRIIGWWQMGPLRTGVNTRQALGASEGSASARSDNWLS